MFETELVKTWGFFPDRIDGEDVFKLAETFQDGDKGEVKAMIEMIGTLPDGTRSRYFMIYASRNGGAFAKYVCNATVNKKIGDRADTDEEFKVPFEFIVIKGQSDAGPYTAIKMLN